MDAYLAVVNAMIDEEEDGTVRDLLEELEKPMHIDRFGRITKDVLTLLLQGSERTNQRLDKLERLLGIFL
jgi:hypothetical protein